jgi:hypothetical protein
VKRILLLFVLFQSINLSAQLKHLLDTIQYDLAQDRSFFVCLDGKNSFIRDVKTNLFGLQAGYTYNHRTNVYIGYYTSLSDNIRIIDNPTALVGKTDTNTLFSEYGLAYFNFGCEYYFYNSKKWRFALPVAIGIGSGWDKQFTQKKVFRDQYNFAMPVDVGFYASYKIKWWIWVGAGIGTRLSLFSNEYSGPFYTGGFNIRFGEIYNRSHKWVKKTF